MLDLVRSNLPAVRELCSRYRVRRLHLFGSAARGEFRAGSDVDLLEPGPIRNPYLRETIEQTKLLLYEAA